ncbi:MAG: hypothetical protein PUC23_00915 [bacterium]|nr:hypothetical protein [bacterium]
MMGEENNSRKVFLSVLGVAILLVAVVGISFAAYTLSTTSNEANTISTGTITMSYTEPTNGILLENALPVADDTAKVWTEAGKVFSFTVAATASGTVTVPYEISVTKDGASNLADSAVKIYLTKGDLGTETAVFEPKLMSTVVGQNKGLRTGSDVIHTETVNFVSGNAANATTKYNLRIWVDSAATVTQGQNYKIFVNVDSAVKPIGK